MNFCLRSAGWAERDDILAKARIERLNDGAHPVAGKWSEAGCLTASPERISGDADAV
jgi:hypothetical protein